MALIRYNVTEGPLAEIQAELDAYGNDRLAQGKLDEAIEFASAMAALQDVGDAVRVGSTLYRVTGE